MKHSSITLFIAAILVAASLSARGTAQSSQAAASNAAAIAEGQALFSTYCASCHGPSGHGNGPVADALHVHPPDLATLTARLGGMFVPVRIERIIDGRDLMVAHGTLEMPVWGDALMRHEGLSDRIVRGR